MQQYLALVTWTEPKSSDVRNLVQFKVNNFERHFIVNQIDVLYYYKILYLFWRCETQNVTLEVVHENLIVKAYDRVVSVFSY